MSSAILTTANKYVKLYLLQFHPKARFSIPVGIRQFSSAQFLTPLSQEAKTTKMIYLTGFPLARNNQLARLNPGVHRT